MQVATAMTRASTAFMQVMGVEGTGNVEYLVDEKGRLEAGFEPEEVRVAATNATNRRVALHRAD